MVKHWQISYPELEEPPSFSIKVVGSFQDAMSRQLSEAIRIELRGDSVLNSKSEFNRCRIPRLTINQEQWQQKAGNEKSGTVKVTPDQDILEGSFTN